MRKETISFTPGRDGAFFSIGAGLALACLKAISASCRESVVRRVIGRLLTCPGAIYLIGIRAFSAELWV
jgi:hypothetical protein